MFFFKLRERGQWKSSVTVLPSSAGYPDPHVDMVRSHSDKLSRYGNCHAAVIR